MPSNLTILLLLLFVLACCLPGTYAFGAGNIPSFAYLEGRAFRHGDIEDCLEEIVKGGGGLLASIGAAKKFGGLDIKRVYFGNWLRDYSQAVDIASLKKLPLQTIINLCMVLGFLAHGYATNEFEVTSERLACYLPTEHIDNPKGYGGGEDPRKYDPRLRGPVDPRELEIDTRTGMKNYIANENGSWDTSKALVRRTIERCIQLGRAVKTSSGRAEEKKNLYESYRLLGQAMHTLEDFTAHSNWCELVLASMGHRDVFLHVGDAVRIQAPGGKQVAPLITGTFGSSDFTHSLLGEATDHISQASVSDLNKELDKAHTRSRSGPGGSDSDFSVSLIKDLLMKIPDTSDDGMSKQEMQRGMDDCERIRAAGEMNQAPGQGTMGGKKPEEMSPQELHAVLWQVLTFRDRIVKKIEKTIEKIPGLGALIEKVMDSISVFIFTTLEPYIKPLLKSATTGLNAASGEVIDNQDQYEVFNNPSASDPTHSFLSKDHFNLILNEPAGRVAKVVVTHAVTRIAKAWADTKVSVHEVTDDILQCLFHPDFHNSSSKIQREMLQSMRDWVQSLGHKQHQILSRLTKEQVRDHKNIRAAGEGGSSAAEGSAAYNAGLNTQSQITGYVNNTLHGVPGYSQASNLFGKVNDFQSRPPSQQPQGVTASGYGAGGGYAQQNHQPTGNSPFNVSNIPSPFGSGGFGGGGYGGFGRRDMPSAPSEPRLGVGAVSTANIDSSLGLSYVGPASSSFPSIPSIPGPVTGPGQGETSSYYNGPNTSGGGAPQEPSSRHHHEHHHREHEHEHHHHQYNRSYDEGPSYAPPSGPPSGIPYNSRPNEGSYNGGGGFFGPGEGGFGREGGYNPSYGGPPSFPGGPIGPGGMGEMGGGMGMPNANQYAPPSGPPPGFFGVGPPGAPQQGYRPPNGPPPGW